MIDLSLDPDIKIGVPSSSAPQTNDVTAPPCPSRTPIFLMKIYPFLLLYSFVSLNKIKLINFIFYLN